MKIFEFFRRKKERKPVILKDLTTFKVFRVNAYTSDRADEMIDRAELYVLAESRDDVNVQIRRLVRWGDAEWRTEPVRVNLDEDAETVAAVM